MTINTFANVGTPHGTTPRQNYVNGFRASNDGTSPNTIVNYTAGECLDSSGAFDIYIDATALNLSGNGLNKLDTGTVAASSQYAVYALADSTGFNSPGLIASLNFSNSPQPPFTTNAVGYDIVRRIGFLLTDGSGFIRLFDQLGDNEDKIYQWRTPIEVVASATITSSFVAKPLTAGMPPIALPVQLSAIWTPATAANILYMRPTGSSSTNGITIASGSVVSQAFYTQPFWVDPLLATGQPSVDVKGTAASTDVLEMKVVAVRDLL